MKCNTNTNNYNVPNACGCDFGAKIFGSCNTAKIVLDESKPETLNWTEISVPEILNVPEQKPDIEYIDQVHAKAEVTCVKLIETPYLFDYSVYPLYDVVTIVGGVVEDIIKANARVFIPKTEDQEPPIVTLPNEEGTCLTGRKLIVEGLLKQKVVYTADIDVQSVHSAHYEIPFSAFIIPYAKLEGGFKKYENVALVPAGTAVVGEAPQDPIVEEIVYVLFENEIDPDLCEDFCVDVFIEDIYITALDCRTIFKNVTLFLRAKPIPQCGEL